MAIHQFIHILLIIDFSEIFTWRSFTSHHTHHVTDKMILGIFHQHRVSNKGFDLCLYTASYVQVSKCKYNRTTVGKIQHSSKYYFGILKQKKSHEKTSNFGTSWKLNSMNTFATSKIQLYYSYGLIAYESLQKWVFIFLKMGHLYASGTRSDSIFCSV